MENKRLLSIIKQLPNTPGVYQFKDVRGRLLYIGKAKNLKKRVSSYFTKTYQDDKTKLLVNKVYNIQITITKNEVEAFLLEANLIKKNKPPYNIDLKEGSGRYAYLQITNEPFPRIVTARSVSKSKSGKLFGPYTSSETRREAQYLANSTFKLRTCNALPKQACLLYHINLCSAPCIKNISAEEYAENVKKAISFLSGEIKPLIFKLEKEMKSYARDLKYEQAKIRRDQIIAIKRISERQNIELPKGYDQDIFNFISTTNAIVINVFNVKKGLVSSIKEYNLKYNEIITNNKNSIFIEFLQRYYDDHHTVPDEIVLPSHLADIKILSQYLTKVKGANVRFVVPQKGRKKELLNLLYKNLEQNAQVGNAILHELQQKLNLSVFPNIIEMFDISHTSGTEIVASMVQFKNGVPNRNAYRKFKLKTVASNDDFASMREVIYRRYHSILSQGKPLPDLIVVDGGRGQLSAALTSLQTLGITKPLISLAKKEEDIYTVGRRFPVKLHKHSPSLQLMQRIRDEAHRFAITFHRQRRSKKLLS